MKKMMAIMMALAMLLCGTALAEAAVAVDGADIGGTWYLNYAQFGDTKVSTVDLGMEIVLTFSEDGTGVAMESENGEAMDFAWALEDGAIKMTVNGETQEITFDGENLLMGEEGATMVFTREAPVATELPEAVEAESEEAFYGNWVSGKVKMGDVVVEASVSGQSITMEYGPDALKMTSLTQEDGSQQTVEMAHKFENGAVTIIDEGEAIATLKLNEDGTLQVVYTFGEMEMAIYMVPAEAE